MPTNLPPRQNPGTADREIGILIAVFAFIIIIASLSLILLAGQSANFVPTDAASQALVVPPQR